MIKLRPWELRIIKSILVPVLKRVQDAFERGIDGEQSVSNQYFARVIGIVIEVIQDECVVSDE